MTDKLTVYNLALTHLGERETTLVENRQPRRLFDLLWTTVTGYCLAQGIWKFAMRDSGALGTTSAGHGFSNAWTKPTDIIHLVGISDQAAVYPPIDRDYLDLGSVLYTNTAALYARYTSNDATAGGMLLTGWTNSFALYVSAALARMAAFRITGNFAIVEEMRDAEDDAYLASFSIDSVCAQSGILPMNAQARAPLANEMVQGQPQLMPFAAYQRAMARAAAKRKGQGE